MNNHCPQKLDYHSTECIYSPTAYRGHARALVKDLEAIRPSAIVDIVSLFFSLKNRTSQHTLLTCTYTIFISFEKIYSGEAMAASLKLAGRRAGGEAAPGTEVKGRKPAAKPTQQTCVRCDSLSSQTLCQACVLLESLNKGVASVLIT